MCDYFFKIYVKIFPGVTNCKLHNSTKILNLSQKNFDHLFEFKDFFLPSIIYMPMSKLYFLDADTETKT